MNIKTPCVRILIVASAAGLVAGCCTSCTYPDDVTRVAPYSNPSPPPPVSQSVYPATKVVLTPVSQTVKPVPPSRPKNVSATQTSTVSNSQAPIVPVAISKPVTPPAPVENEVKRPVVPIASVMDLKAKIGAIQSLRNQGVLTQEEADRLILRAVEQGQ